MPFKSRAQLKAALANAKTPEEKAKIREWLEKTENVGDLPEKLHPEDNPEKKKVDMKLASVDGMFFQKRAQSKKGRFFRDQAGRDDAAFHEKTAMFPGRAGTTGQMGIAGTGQAMGGMGGGGMGMGGGMYGTGEGDKKSESTKKRETDEEKLLRLLAAAGKGEERPAKADDEDKPEKEEEPEPEKTAQKVPSDWDADSGLPTGFHRPAYEQPEALEEGGERFHSTEAKGPDFGVGEGLQDTTRQAKLKKPPGTGHQMGKHASLRYLGTSFSKEAGWTKERVREGGESTERGVKHVLRKGDEAVRGVTTSAPLTIGALVAMGLLGRRLGKKGLAKLKARRAPAAPPPQTIGERIRAMPEAVRQYFGAAKPK
jgi:hypothetical protein